MQETKQDKLMFVDAAHEKFYLEKMDKCASKDCWHRALIYTLGLTEDIRKHFDEVYDLYDGSINRDSLRAGWATGTDTRVMRLAFTLYTDYVPSQGWERYQLSEIFGYGGISNLYLCQAILLRFGY